jgi:Mn-dependent DtxR family transcriptional regulator
MKPIRSTEDYLETIYKIRQVKKIVHLSDIAKELEVSRPSVTQMVQKLHRAGYVIYKPYVPVELTQKGERIGKKIAQRHAVLAEFLTLLDIPEYIQEKDIHGIEHFLSPATLKGLKRATKFLKEKNFKK